MENDMTLVILWTSKVDLRTWLLLMIFKGKFWPCTRKVETSLLWSLEDTERERSVSYSEDSFTQRSQKKHQRDNYVHDNNLVDERCEKGSHPSIAVRDLRSHHHTQRSSSEVEDMPSSPKWHSKRRHVHHHTSFEKHSERRDKCGSDSSRSHHQTCKEKEVERKRNRSDIKRQLEECTYMKLLIWRVHFLLAYIVNYNRFYIT
ncbi:uncharacterized protein LOC115959842 [Quercus lobata]|uniref:uncharacterized protein LOC115959842 n=1 Tax=Quercus lobata TaxID=97700 RepID=UPI001245BCF4|nr:uncharacterized protein LOC115959842 [Quercus lobata]